MSDAKKDNFFWPDVSSLESAKKAVGYGVVAAGLVAALTTAFATWALISQSTVVGFIDAWAYVDAVLLTLIAFGIYKESRFAAVFGLSAFIAEKAYQIHATEKFDGAVMAVFIIVFFVSSVRGTFALYRLRCETNKLENASL